MERNGRIKKNTKTNRKKEIHNNQLCKIMFK